jgi:hypothetical protein
MDKKVLATQEQYDEVEKEFIKITSGKVKYDNPLMY